MPVDDTVLAFLSFFGLAGLAVPAVLVCHVAPLES
jgi:hypothetical protein